MKGKIGFDPRMKCHYVTWYNGGKTRKIYHYKGRKLDSCEMAEQLLSDMRSDQKRGVFSIEKYHQSRLQRLIHKRQTGGSTTKGTIGFDPRMKCHYVAWYHGG